MTLRSGVFLALIVALGCSDRGRPPPTEFTFASIPDGSQVIRISPVDIEAAPSWEISLPPAIQVGAEDDKVVFGGIRDVATLSGGRIAVADAVDADVKIMDTAGTLLTRLGRKGAGPGEFNSPGFARECGSDLLWVFDRRLLRLTELDSTGTVVGLERIRFPDQSPPRWKPVCNSQGAFAGTTTPTGYSPDLPVGPLRPSVSVVVRASPTDSFRVVTSIPGADAYKWETQLGPLPAFGRVPNIALSDTSVFVTTGDGFEVAEYSLQGDMLSLTVADVEPYPVTAADLDDVVDYQLGRTEPQYHPTLERTLREMIWPPNHPPIQGLLIDHEGCMWIQHFKPGPTRRWVVLGRDRTKVVGAVELPGAFKLTDIDDDRLLGYTEDRLGDTKLTVFQYVRPAIAC